MSNPGLRRVAIGLAVAACIVVPAVAIASGGPPAGSATLDKKQRVGVDNDGRAWYLGGLQTSSVRAGLFGPIPVAGARCGAPITLSQKEFALVRTLAADPTRQFTKDELLRTIWGFRALDTDGAGRRTPLQRA